jgi:hypothetical protein
MHRAAGRLSSREALRILGLGTKVLYPGYTSMEQSLVCRTRKGHVYGGERGNQALFDLHTGKCLATYDGTAIDRRGAFLTVWNALATRPVSELADHLS